MRTDQRANVMLIDDDEDDYYLLNQAFGNYSKQVTLSHQQTVTELLESLLHLDSLPDLILLDFNIPPSNALDVLAVLKQDSRTNMIPVIVWSGSLEKGQITQCYQAGANSVLLKSPSLSGLVHIVRQLCEYWFEASQLPS
ncbi:MULTISPECIES: response regulator [Spirosoma]|uniref:Response regulator n=1 Tax=Spirosoma liriopis TaxID=2937440 RepID=A0ABT0HP90_9BACT|nr:MULTISPECIES: response regulator [Spirosoma]MCK8493984.1 response regulator [Spirosoma liriopis]UHG89003.1 response regulator [Spirosoma oryzicola]